jgi:hypothetical protein
VTQFNITFRGSVETGEGHVSKADLERFTALCNENSLLAADIAKDWMHEAESLYEKARAAMTKDFAAKRAKARAQTEGPIQ